MFPQCQTIRQDELPQLKPEVWLQWQEALDMN